MKRILTIAVLSCAAVAASAQTMYDALTFSSNEYYGTARSIAMGNAMTAVGGDLGSIGINPAGSAVNGYSQFTVTPNVTVSSANSSYSAYPVNGTDYFTNEQKKNFGRFNLPNVGLMFNISTGRRTGLKSISYGVVANRTSDFTDKMIAGGLNDQTSYLSSVAVGADGWDIDVLNGYMDLNGNSIDDWRYAYTSTNAPFNTIVNAQAGAIANFGNSSDSDYYERYIAATEGYDDNGDGTYSVYLGGPLNQAYGRRVTGNKTDWVFNVGFNFSDFFYVGANFGVTLLDYSYDEYFKEAADNISDFPIYLIDASGDEYTTYFSNYRTRYSYSAEGQGIYAKIGFIVRPVAGLRIGGAIQTPTTLYIDERWQHAVDIHYEGGDSGYAYSPEGEYSYKLRTPYRANVGVAYTFLGMAMVSADYELVDYSTMKFKNRDGGFSNTWDDVNDDIADCMGVSHLIRVGAEIKPVPELAIRAGYSFSTTPEYYYDGYVKTTLHDKTNAASIGVGYSSPGSFFCDLAGRMIMYADEYISPYADYLDDVASPLILNKRNKANIVATIGWRF